MNVPSTAKLKKKIAKTVYAEEDREKAKPYAVYKCGCGANPKILNANMVPERLMCLRCSRVVMAKRVYPKGWDE